jgi:hypothetical protein
MKATISSSAAPARAVVRDWAMAVDIADRLSGRMKDKYITAYLASIKLNENAAICRLMCDSDPPSRAPDDEVGFLCVRPDCDVVHLVA